MTAAAQAFDFQSHFASVHDPRINRTKYHQLMDILFISVAATIGGADGPSDIEDFARQNLAWCRRFVSLANGVPSHDTIGRVMSLIKPEQFQVSFLDWIAALASTRRVLRRVSRNSFRSTGKPCVVPAGPRSVAAHCTWSAHGPPSKG